MITAGQFVDLLKDFAPRLLVIVHDNNNNVFPINDVWISDNGKRVYVIYVEGDENTQRTAVLAFKRFANLDPKSATPAFEAFAEKFKISDTERLEIFQIIAKGFLSIFPFKGE